MFNNLRRPVPSKAALKVLYQLAYISSGTAVGIATLCTEERRRQAKIVQKIADNAKRIRQSPRYVHNATAAARKENHEPMGDWEEVEEGDVKNEHKRRRARDPGLPSSVERGYEQLVLRDYKRTRRRRNPTRDIGEESKEDAFRCRSETVKAHEREQHSRKLVRRLTRSNALVHIYRMSNASDRLAYAGQEEVEMSGGTPSRLRRLLDAAREEDVFNSHEARSDTARSLSHDLSLFFEKQPWSVSGETERHVADHLLFKAVKLGTLTEIRSLYQWIIARDALQPEHVIALLDARHDLADRADHQKLFEFYDAILSTDAFQTLTFTAQIRYALDLSVETKTWDLDMQAFTCLKRALKPLLRIPHDEAYPIVDQICRELLVKGDAPRAHRLMVTLMALRRNGWNAIHLGQLEQWDILRTMVFSSALENGQLTTAYGHLVHTLRHDRANCLSVLEQFSFASSQFNSYRNLARFLPHEDPRCDIDDLTMQLSDTAKMAIAKACLWNRQRPVREPLFNRLFSTLPEEMRASLAEARTSRLLQDQWKSTLDFQATWDAYLSAKAFALERGDTRSRLATDMAMIDICNAANRPDQALELLQDHNQRVPHSSQSISIAAVSLAKKNAWSQLSKLMGVLEKSGSFVQDHNVSRCFNKVIELFARKHSAVDTWRFVADLIEKLRFSPTWTTTNIVLRSFVRKRHLSFVSHWMRYLRTMGHQVEMDAKTAAGLVTEYFLEQRPPHVLVMWFCRSIVRLMPSFDVAEFKTVTLQAVAYDLRKGSERVRAQAEKDLAALQGSEDIIPKPFNELRESSSIIKLSNHDAAPGEIQQHEGAFMDAGSIRSDVDGHSSADSDRTVEQSGVAESSQQVVQHSSAAEGELQLQTSRKPEDMAEDHFHDIIRELNTGLDSSPPNAGAESQPAQDDLDDSLFWSSFEEVSQQEDSVVDDGLADLEASLTSTKSPDDIERKTELKMILAFSEKRYEEIVEIYFSCLSSEGLPISARALEITLEASLRLHNGDRTEVDEIVAQARRAGMNVSCAMGPILVHHMKNLGPDDKRDANNLRLMVMRYYRSNEDNGLRVSNHIGVTAANVLINNHRPEYGINLLTDISRSKWIQEQPLDIAVMSVYLKGFAALRSAKGIQWTIETVLRKKMRIDRTFLNMIKKCAKSFEAPGADPRSKPSSRPNDLRARLRVWRRICGHRRILQRYEAKVFGKNLVRFIVKLSKQLQQPAIDAEVRTTLEAQLFGSSMSLEGRKEPVNPEKRVALRRARARIARAIRWEEGPRHEGRRTTALVRNFTWLKQYRAFLRKDIVMPGGKLSSFRYRLASVPRFMLVRAARRRRLVQEAQETERADGGQVVRQGEDDGFSSLSAEEPDGGREIEEDYNAEKGYQPFVCGGEEQRPDDDQQVASEGDDESGLPPSCAETDGGRDPAQDGNAPEGYRPFGL